MTESYWDYPSPYWQDPNSYPSVSHIGHKNHLCELAENGIVTLDMFKTLVKDAKFICRKCGRVAVKEANLCEPVPL